MTCSSIVCVEYSTSQPTKPILDSACMAKQGAGAAVGCRPRCADRIGVAGTGGVGRRLRGPGRGPGVYLRGAGGFGRVVGKHVEALEFVGHNRVVLKLWSCTLRGAPGGSSVIRYATRRPAKVGRYSSVRVWSIPRMRPHSGLPSVGKGKIDALPRGESSSHAPGLACNDGLSRLDPYVVIARLGVSWVGEVWRVRNQQSDGEYALKVLPPAFTRNDQAWERFRRRTRWLTECNHPHIVAPFDVVRNRRASYAVMELIPGHSLDQIIEKSCGGPMSLERTADLLDQLCSALEVAQDYFDETTGKAWPIPHLGIRPSHLMLVDSQHQGPRPQLKVLGFGIALLIDEQFAANAPLVDSCEARFPTRVPSGSSLGTKSTGGVTSIPPG